jgi:Tol biopolymer transport system component
MNRKPYSNILDEVARDHMAHNTDLAAHILARIQKGKGATMQSRTKVFVTAVLILLMLVIVLANVPAVRAAVQRWFGYVPNIGLVGEGEIRVLAESVSVTRDGITLTVEQVVVDSAHTTLVYSVESLKEGLFEYKNPGLNGPRCYEDASLVLPEDEGTILFPSEMRGEIWATGYKRQASYPAIPSQINRLDFVLQCIPYTLSGQAPEGWKLSLNLVPAPPEMTVFPVIEISTPVAAAPTAAPQNRNKIDLDGISLTLDRAVQMEDGYLLYASMHFENTGIYSVNVLDPMHVQLLDAEGQDIPFALDFETLAGVERQPGGSPFTLKTAPIRVAGPLMLIIDSVLVDVPVDARFTFDPGPDPVPGQVWELDRIIDVGFGQSLHVLTATYSEPPVAGMPAQSGLSFEMASATGVYSASLIDLENPVAGGGGGGGGGPASGSFGGGFVYAGDFPQGPLTINVSSIGFNLPGRWEAAWTPPVSQGQANATPQPDACLTRESWPQALKNAAALPTGLRGTLALFEAPPPDYNYKVAVVNLDGGGRRTISLGDSPSLSPDGTRIVYNGPMDDGPPDGLYITDLASGVTTLLPGSARGDSGPLWSPDGSRIAFTRGPSSGLIGAPGRYNIFIVDPAGSDLQQLTNGSEASRAMAWMPDGHHLLYTISGRTGVTLFMLDVQTGQAERLFDVNYAGSMAVSPDGRRVAFEEMLPLDKYGLFVADLDGSNRKLLANGDPFAVTVPLWSPDGEWVLASVHDPDTSKQPNPILALIGVDTCQVIPLPILGGYVSSWLP